VDDQSRTAGGLTNGDGTIGRAREEIESSLIALARYRGDPESSLIENREMGFGGSAVTLPEFRRCCEEAGQPLPGGLNIDAHRPVSVEVLLTAIERHAVAALTPRRALAHLRATKRLVPLFQKLGLDANGDEDDTAQLAQWAAGAEAHAEWRQWILQAWKAGKLKLVSPISGVMLPYPVEHTHPEAGESSPQSGRVQTAPAAWEVQAQEIALAHIREMAERDYFPSQVIVAEHVAKVLRGRGVHGVDGKPLAGATIKRHALKGISSATPKLKSQIGQRGE